MDQFTGSGQADLCMPTVSATSVRVICRIPRLAPERACRCLDCGFAVLHASGLRAAEIRGIHPLKIAQHCCAIKAAIPVLREQGGGLIMQFSSMGGRVGGSPGIASYQAAKFAIDGFSRVLRTETAPFGIK